MHSMRSGPQSIIHAKPSEEKIQLVLQVERNGGVPIEDETEHDGWKITPTVVPVEVCIHRYINIIRLLCGRQNFTWSLSNQDLNYYLIIVFIIIIK